MKRINNCNYTMEKQISMKEHIEILAKQQDYQFAEGFKFGYKEAILKIEKVIDKFSKLRLYRSKSCQLLLIGIKQSLKELGENKL